jgi:hypothetical protein
MTLESFFLDLCNKVQNNVEDISSLTERLFGAMN